MINLQFSIQNPWHNEKRWPWHDLYQSVWRITKNKTLEICIELYSYNLVHFELNTRFWGRDHAGPNLSFGLLGLGFQVQLYDNRHWNYEKNTWETYNEQM